MNKLAEIAGAIPGTTVAAWNDRHYVNVAHDRSMAGDRTTKIWIKGNVLTVEEGKGHRSSAFSAAHGALVDAVTATGAVRNGYSDSISATYTLD